MDVPPPGAAFTTEMRRYCGTAWSATESWNVSWVGLTNVVGRGEVPTSTTEEAIKPDPFTVTVVGEVTPVGSVSGTTVMVPGAGFAIAIEEAAELPPLGEGLTATTERLPAWARSAAVKTALTSVVLTNEVARAEPAT